MTNQPPSPPPTSDGRVLTWLNAVKGLSIANVLVIAMLAIVAVPVYIIYRALDNEKLLDRFMSTYEETANQQSGCTMRHVQERGGPDLWSVSSGFAFQGADRWFVSVVLTHEPSTEEIISYCESLKLIADHMLVDRSSQVYTRPMPRTAPDRSGHDGDLPPSEKEPEQ